MYDADLGRFVSRDPIGYERDLALYVYVTDNPVLHTDPSGMVTEVSDTTPPDKPIGGWNLANIATCYELCVASNKTNIACTECVEDCYDKHKNICLKQKAMNVRVACDLAAHEGLKAFSGVCAYYPDSTKVCPPKSREACCYVRIEQRQGQTYTKGVTVDCDLPKTASQCCKEQFEDRTFGKRPVLFSAEGACK